MVAARGRRTSVTYLNSTEQKQMRDRVTKVFAGVKMDDPLWKSVAVAFNWQNVWPVIDTDLELTGEVVEPQGGDYLPHFPGWDAVISRQDAEAAGWVIDEGHGFAHEPRIS